jgi:Protein of unknown function (DUF2867)
MTLPRDAQLVAPRDKLNYFDCQIVTLPHAVTALEAWRLVMARPLPGMKLAFRIRDAISARFGVARIGGFSGAAVVNPQVGERLDFFTVEAIRDDLLTLTARDTHLDVMICVTVAGAEFAITASVIPHNWFGRLYMIPVGPAHRLIVWAMLRHLRRDSAR